MKHNHLLVAGALATALLTAACGQVASPAASPKRASAASAKVTKPVAQPLAGDDKSTAKADLESLWSGSVGGQSASMSLSWGGVRVDLGPASFDGQISGQSVYGTLRRRGVPTPAHVSLSGFGQSMSGRIGDLSANVQFGGDFVSGFVGQRSISVSVTPTSVSGFLANRSVFLGGTGVQQGEGPGLVAAIVVLAAAAE